MRCNRKATFHYKGKLQEVFRAGLNEIKYDYVDSKQHFYLRYNVGATNMKASGDSRNTKLGGHCGTKEKLGGAT